MALTDQIRTIAFEKSGFEAYICADGDQYYGIVYDDNDVTVGQTPRYASQHEAAMAAGRVNSEATKGMVKKDGLWVLA